VKAAREAAFYFLRRLLAGESAADSLEFMRLAGYRILYD